MDGVKDLIFKENELIGMNRLGQSIYEVRGEEEDIKRSWREWGKRNMAEKLAGYLNHIMEQDSWPHKQCEIC